MASILKQAFNGQTNTSNQQPNLQEMYQNFQKNPMEYLSKANLDIPKNINNPEAIVRHLASTGQIPRQLLPRVNALLGKK